jgi:hypothetical protein
MRTERSCRDCGDPVSGRRRRCEGCRKAERARAMRERRAAESGADQWNMSEEPVIDYMVMGAASKPPSFDGVPRQPKKTSTQEVIGDGHVPSPAERQHRPSLDGIPNYIRRDRARLDQELDQELAQQIRAEENELASWDQLQAAGERMATTVDFSRPVTSFRDEGRPRYAITDAAAAGQLYGPTPGYGAAAAGNAYRPAQPAQPNRGQQRLPHII